MECIYEFDNAVNVILSGCFDENVKNTISLFIKEIFKPYGMTEALYLICIEREMYDASKYISDIAGIDLKSFICNSVGLYSEKNREKAKCHIKNQISYSFNAKSNDTYMVLYDLIKNKCYDLIRDYLDLFELFDVEKNSMSRLMGIAVKNKDIESLRIFLERNFCFNDSDIDYLKAFDEDYFIKTIIPELEKIE